MIRYLPAKALTVLALLAAIAATVYLIVVIPLNSEEIEGLEVLPAGAVVFLMLSGFFVTPALMVMLAYVRRWTHVTATHWGGATWLAAITLLTSITFGFFYLPAAGLLLLAALLRSMEVSVRWLVSAISRVAAAT